MSQWHKLLLLACLLFIFLFCGLFKVLAEDNNSQILFQDDFSKKSLDHWIIENGQWNVDSNKRLYGFEYGYGKSGLIRTNPQNWTNYRVETDVTALSGVDQIIEFRRNDDANKYQLVLRYRLDNIFSSNITLNRFQNNQKVQVAQSINYSLEQYSNYKLKIEVVNDHIQVWIDNELLIDIEDTRSTVHQGGIALGYQTPMYGWYYASFKFDNLIVSPINFSPVKMPVIFIPGIGGSELETKDDIFWVEQDDGRGGKYSHAYTKNEKIWVNQNEAAALGEDDYFDILRLMPDGITSAANLGTTGHLVSQGYGDIDNFFNQNGYEKDKTYFIFAYDWRKDVRTNKQQLDNLIEYAKNKSGQTKVNLVVHSMGGLIARDYIADDLNGQNVNKLIELGVPHLGSPIAIKNLLYGSWMGNDYYLFKLGITPTETKDVFSSLTSAYQLLPSANYYNFYNNSAADLIYPFRDDRDIDNNQITQSLGYTDTQSLIKSLGYNQTALEFANQYHNLIDPQLNKNFDTKIYLIVGTNQPTLGQINETWWIKWPIEYIPRTEELFINGDGTVPLYSASLKSEYLDLSNNNKTYYVDQAHTDLIRNGSPSMATVKMILDDEEILPVKVKSEKYTLEGTQVSLNNGEIDIYDQNHNHCGLDEHQQIECNIEGVYFDTTANSHQVFIKKTAPTIKANVQSAQTAITMNTYTYQNDQVTQQLNYHEINLPTNQPTEIPLETIRNQDKPVLEINQQIITPEVIYPNTQDQTKPQTNIQINGQSNENSYLGPVTISLTAEDSSEILKIEYSLDQGINKHIYTEPFTISESGNYVLQLFSTDKAGNQELPQEIIFKISDPVNVLPTPDLKEEIASPSSELELPIEATSTATISATIATNTNNYTQDILTPPSASNIIQAAFKIITNLIEPKSRIIIANNSFNDDQEEPASISAQQSVLGTQQISDVIPTLYTAPQSNMVKSDNSISWWVLFRLPFLILVILSVILFISIGFKRNKREE